MEDYKNAPPVEEVEATEAVEGEEGEEEQDDILIVEGEDEEIEEDEESVSPNLRNKSATASLCQLLASWPSCGSSQLQFWHCNPLGSPWAGVCSFKVLYS